jgi:hypothetical protein
MRLSGTDTATRTRRFARRGERVRRRRATKKTARAKKTNAEDSTTISARRAKLYFSGGASPPSGPRSPRTGTWGDSRRRGAWTRRTPGSARGRFDSRTHETTNDDDRSGLRDGEKRLFVSVSFLMDDGLARRNRNLKESTSRARARGRSSTWRRFEERGLEVWVALSSAGLRQQLRQRNDEPREKRACRCYTGARPRGHRPTDHAGRSRLARDRGAVGADLRGGRRDLPHRGGRTVPFSGEARAVHHGAESWRLRRGARGSRSRRVPPEPYGCSAAYRRPPRTDRPPTRRSRIVTEAS